MTLTREEMRLVYGRVF